MKRWLSMLLACVVVFCCVPWGMQASAGFSGGGRTQTASFHPFVPAEDTASKTYASLMDSLAAQLRTYDGSNGENFTVSVENPFSMGEQERYDYFDTLMLHTIRENPEFFWVNLGSRVQQYDTKSNVVTYSVSIFPEFRGNGFAKAQKVFSDTLEQVTAEIFQPGMSEMEKVLSAYGWIKQNVQYDAAAGWDAYSAYSALVNRSAVCHGCAVTMNLLLGEAGVGCYTVLSIVESGEMYHIWNAVNVGGQWYNLDPTAGFVPGYFSYDKFLRSTSEMLSGGSFCEHVTRMHVSCEEAYPADTPWQLSSFAFLYSEKHQSLVNVENCMQQNGKVVLKNPAIYRRVSIDDNGEVTSEPLASIPAYVKCCSQEYEDCLYYLTFSGELRVHTVSTGEDRSLSPTNYKGLYMHLDTEQKSILIVDNQGAVKETVPLCD